MVGLIVDLFVVFLCSGFRSPLRYLLRFISLSVIYVLYCEVSQMKTLRGRNLCEHFGAVSELRVRYHESNLFNAPVNLDVRAGGRACGRRATFQLYLFDNLSSKSYITFFSVDCFHIW